MTTHAPRQKAARLAHHSKPAHGPDWPAAWLLPAAFVVALLSSATPARAAPPPMGSSDWEIMRDFADWVQHQTGRSGQWCCDLADGRPLAEDEIRIAGDHYQILYSRIHWPDAPEPAEWLDVPPGALLRQLSPVGYVVAWVHHRYVFCVALVGAS